MSTVADLNLSELRALLSGDGLTLAIHPFVVRVNSSITGVADAMGKLYADYEVTDSDTFADFHVELAPGRGLRRLLGKRQSRFLFDGSEPFKPLPMSQAYPSFEWGLNWCVANHCHQYLIVHAAVAERGGRAAILAAPPGSGKSTLCAGLVHRGWRLFSDELALIDATTGDIVPIPRPVCLKNESIRVIGEFAPAAEFGPLVRDTRKGTVTHMRAPTDSVRKSQVPAQPGWIIFPRFESGIKTGLRPLSKARAGHFIAGNAFNFSTLGESGFATVNGLIEASDAFELDYGDLADATRLLSEMADTA